MCGTNTCVDIKPDGTDFRFTSTIGEDKGAVLYNRDDVKAGKWDHLLGPDAPGRPDHSKMTA
jgi:hypothetical protein